MHEEAGGITAVGATSAALHLRAHGVRHLFCGGEVGGTRSAPCSPLCAARSGCGGKVTWSVAQAGLCLGWSGRAMRGFAGQKARRWRAASRLGVHAAAAAPVRGRDFPVVASVFPTLPLLCRVTRDHERRKKRRKTAIFRCWGEREEREKKRRKREKKERKKREKERKRRRKEGEGRKGKEERKERENAPAIM